MRLLLAASLALILATPSPAQYNNYGYQTGFAAPRSSGGMSAKTLCGYAEAAEAHGDYVKAFSLYKQGCGVTVGARIAATPEEMLYFSDHSGQIFPKAVAQLQRA